MDKTSFEKNPLLVAHCLKESFFWAACCSKKVLQSIWLSVRSNWEGCCFCLCWTTCPLPSLSLEVEDEAEEGSLCPLEWLFRSPLVLLPPPAEGGETVDQSHNQSELIFLLLSNNSSLFISMASTRETWLGTRQGSSSPSSGNIMRGEDGEMGEIDWDPPPVPASYSDSLGLKDKQETDTESRDASRRSFSIHFKPTFFTSVKFAVIPVVVVVVVDEETGIWLILLMLPVRLRASRLLEMSTQEPKYDHHRVWCQRKRQNVTKGKNRLLMFVDNKLVQQNSMEGARKERKYNVTQKVKYKMKSESVRVKLRGIH